MEAEAFEPPPWSCGMDHLPEKEDLESTERRLSHTHDHHDHDHEGHIHTTPHDHHDHEGHTHTHDHSDIDLQSIKDGLRGSSIRLGKRRKLQAAGYNYQVDIYLEIDNQLCVNNGESCPAGGSIPPNTMNYVNSIFAGANSVYEVRSHPLGPYMEYIYIMCPYHMLLVLFLYVFFLHAISPPPNIYPHFKHDHTQSEIDTHLNIIHIQSTSLYDQYSSTSQALTAMRNQFSGSSWHYPGMDLHTALLGNQMGGGIAYLGVLCSEYIMTSHALD